MTHDLTELNSNKLFRLKEQMKKIIELGFKVNTKFKGESEHITVNIYAGYFQRLTYCFEAVLALLKDFESEKTHQDYSIALIIRASLLDILTILYLKSYYEDKDIHKNSELNYDTEFAKFLSSQIRRSFNVSDADKRNEHFDFNQFKEYVNAIYSKYHYLFDRTKKLDYNKPSKSLIFGKGNHEITTKDIINRLNSIPDKSNINHDSILKLYNLYSKHDHFGVMSLTLQLMDINEIFRYILGAFYYIVDGMSFCMEFLRSEENIEDEYKQLRIECGSLKGVVITDNLYLSDDYKKGN